jgi:hypothetical protein
MQGRALAPGISLADLPGMRERLIQSTEELNMEICPRCHRKRVLQLRSMARHSNLEWFKCDGCDHLFTRAPLDEDSAAPEAAAS